MDPIGGGRSARSCKYAAALQSPDGCYAHYYRCTLPRAPFELGYVLGSFAKYSFLGYNRDFGSSAPVFVLIER